MLKSPMLKVFLPLLVTLALSPLSPALAAPELRLQTGGAGFRQGEPFKVELAPDGEMQVPLKLMLANQQIGLFEQNGKFVCYAGTPADQKPGGYTLRVLDAAGQEVVSQKIELLRVPRSTQSIRYYPPPTNAEQKALLAKEDKIVDDAIANTRSPEQFWQGTFSRPVPHAISSYYGVFRYLNGKYNGYHGGIDFLSPMGTPIKAPAGARVALARYFSKANSNGNLVLLDHGLGVTSVYLHLSKILVKEGQLVKKGEPFALVGSTGRSTGPHLHWGVYLNGKNTDALSWIKFSEQLTTNSEQ